MDFDTAEEQQDLIIPFDVGLPPDTLLSDDPPSQEQVFQAAVFNADFDHDEEDTFDAQPKQNRNLRYYKHMYERGDSIRAVTSLENRAEIKFRDSSFVTPASSPDLAWMHHGHFLDLMIFVGDGLGLGALMPNLRVHHNFEMTIDLSQPYRTFSTKFAKLGFDPTGCIQFIGRSPASEDVWLAWTPRVISEAEESVIGVSTKSTALSTRRSRMAYMFLVKMLQEIGVRDILVLDMYPDVMDDEAFRNATRIPDRSKIYLSFRQLTNFDKAIVAGYNQWVRNAPANYTNDDHFFRERHPVAMTSRYGQNQELNPSPGDQDEERENWERDRQYHRIRYISVAIASHIRVREAAAWTPRNVDDIIEEYQDGIFTTPYPDSREEIDPQDLDDIPLVSDEGLDIPLYSLDGFQIQRKTASFRRDVKPHGVLVDLQQTKKLFTNDIDELFEEEPCTTDFTVYPQAGLKSVGHFQAKGLVAGCYPLIKRINKLLEQPFRDDDDGPLDDDDDDDDDDDELVNRPVIQGIASQGYNALTHYTRGRTAQHHEVQVGQVTGALAGMFATTPQHTNLCRRLIRTCEQALPHQAFSEKVQSAAISTDLRLENVYCIDMKALRPEKRNGRTILEHILRPLSCMWQHGDLLKRVKESVVLFKPEAFPAIYNWTSFPLTCAIESIFEQAMSNNIISKKDPLLVEICSVAERALNYMHTGNAAVIATSVMNPMWIGRAIIQDGLPCFNPKYVMTGNGTRIKVNAEVWPFNKKKHQPLSSSKRSQVLTYGEQYFNMFLAHLSMELAGSRPMLEWTTANNPQDAACRSILFHALAIFIQDCKTLVENHVRPSISSDIASENGDKKELGLRRRKALKEWMNMFLALAWSTGKQSKAETYLCLITILHRDPETVPSQLPKSKDSWTYEILAKHLFKMGTNEGNTVEAPVTSSGSFAMALRLAIIYIRKIRGTTPDVDAFIVLELGAMMRRMHIDFIPWKKNSKGARAAQATEWMILHRGGGSSSGAIQLPRSREEVAQEMAEQTKDDEPGVEWEIPGQLYEMKGLWKKELLPMDWDIKYASLETQREKAGAEYVWRTYEFVESQYDGRLWKHHLALICGILFSRVAPFIFFPRNVPLPQNASPEDLTKAIREVPWTKNTGGNHKGMTAARPFVTMVTTSLIGFWDTRTPFYEHLQANNMSQGENWTSKHGNKEIHAANFIRMGLAQAYHAGVVRLSKYGSNWKFLPDDRLKRLYERLKEMLLNNEYGEYFAIQTLFGEDTAKELARRGQVISPKRVT